MESKTDRPPLTAAQFLSITRAYIEQLTKIWLRDVDEDIRLVPTLDVVDETYKQAYWRKFGNLMGALHEQLTRTPANEEEKWNLILEVYGDQFPDLLSTGMRPDVKSRLDWLKRRIAKEFEVDFTRQTSSEEGGRESFLTAASTAPCKRESRPSFTARVHSDTLPHSIPSQARA